MRLKISNKKICGIEMLDQLSDGNNDIFIG